MTISYLSKQIATVLYQVKECKPHFEQRYVFFYSSIKHLSSLFKFTHELGTKGLKSSGTVV